MVKYGASVNPKTLVHSTTILAFKRVHVSEDVLATSQGYFLPFVKVGR